MVLYKCIAVFVIIMKYTQQIQNKRTQVNVIVHNANTFPLNGVRESGIDHTEKIREISLIVNYLSGLNFPDQHLKYHEKKKSPI